MVFLQVLARLGFQCCIVRLTVTIVRVPITSENIGQDCSQEELRQNREKLHLFDQISFPPYRQRLASHLGTRQQSQSGL